MSLSAKQLFPTWYKRAGYETDPATIKMRVDAFDKLIAKDDDIDFWKDIIKIYLGIRVSGKNVNDYVDFFVAEDPAFPLTDNQNILRHLAGAAIAILLDSDDGDLTKEIALSIKTAIFLNQYDLSDFGHVLIFAGLNLQQSTASERQSDIEQTETDLDELQSTYKGTGDDTVADFRNSEMNSLLGVVQDLVTINKSLSEEINVHWWLFGEYSSEAGEKFSDIPVERMAFISPVDLYKLTKFQTVLSNSRQFLSRVLQSSKGGTKSKTLNLFDAISALSTDDKKLILGEESPSFFTPLLLAIKCSEEVTEGDWSVHFKAVSNQGDLKKDHGVTEIANQLYMELMLSNLE